jgi:RHS repeat-associated protein
MTRVLPRTGIPRFRAAVVPAFTSLLLAVGVVAAVPASASAAAATRTPASPLPVAAQRPVSVHRVAPRPLRLPAMRVPKPPAAAWPAPGSALATVSPAAVTAGTTGTTGARGPRAALPGALSRQAGSLPVWVGPAPGTGGRQAGFSGAVQVTMSGHGTAAAAGIPGVIFSVRRAGAGPAGRVHVALDYARFAEAYGGDYASRLRLVELPACVLSTPARPSCRRETPVGSQDDVSASVLGADVPVPAAASASRAGAMVLATVTSAAGGAGNFSATPLEQAGSWAHGGSSGAFTYSYPVQVPPVPGGLEPAVSLDYDSQALDGLTSSTNNQASEVGDGWSYTAGYIQRDYASCGQVSAELTAAKKTDPIPATAAGDLCWSDLNTVSLVLNGKATTLVPTSTAGTTWRAQDDSNETIQYKTGTSNGTKLGGYWELTEPDGKSYFFGVNELPGWASGDPSTQAAQNVQVFGVNSGDPCYSSTWTSSSCYQTWRWNLAYVTDPHLDAMVYEYASENNAYVSQATSGTADYFYTRGAGVSKIYYGMRVGSYYASSGSAWGTAIAEVHFSESQTGRTDIPSDLACANGSACSVYTPSFWTSYELNSITTWELEGSGTSQSLKAVDEWDLGHGDNATDPDPNASGPLWLGSITRVGEDGLAATPPPLALPAVTFTGQYLANRDEPSSGDNYPTISRERLTGIVTETGEQVTVSYSAPTGGCASGTFPSEDANTGLCYPDWWDTGTASGTVESWFYKYAVTTVAQQNTAGGDVAVVASYCYGGTGTPGSAACLAGGAWHHNDSPLTRSSQRTWDQWRGFKEVTTETGTAPDPVTETQDTYFQGMDGDTLKSGTASVSLTPSRGNGGNSIRDSSQFAATSLENVTCDGAAANGSSGFCPDEVSDTVSIPWTSAATATQALTGLPSLQSFMTGVKETQAFTPGLASGGTRESDATYTHDSDGRVTSVSSVPDTTDASLDTCTTTSWINPATGTILDLPYEVTKVSVPCGTTVKLPDNAVSDEIYLYDGATTPTGQNPPKGNLTKTELATSYAGASPSATPQYTVASTAAYDEYGRTLSATDADGRTTTTAYTPATGQEPTSAAVSDPTTQNGTSATTTELTTTTTYDPARDLPLTVTDPAGGVTTKTYDALGRLTAAWKPGHATSGPASEKFTYTVSDSAPSVTVTQTVNPSGGYQADETLYDSMGRLLQTQDETAAGNTLVSDVQYDSGGRKLLVSNPYYVTGAPTTAQVAPASAGAVPSLTGYAYDGAGRVTQKISETYGSETWETDTAYGGDYTTVTYQNKVAGEPDAGTPQTTFTNGAGKTTRIWQYHAGVTPSVSAAPGSYDQTSYAYTPAGKLAGITDAAGNAWAYQYDYIGDQTRATTPDSGTTASTYDPAGQLTSATDNRGDQVSWTYDADGRKSAEYDTTGGAGQSSSTEIASWSYDTAANGTGLPASSSSYYSGAVYTRQYTGYNGYEEPQGAVMTIPKAAGNLAGSWEQDYGYNQYTGQADVYEDGPDGGLPAESVSTGLDNAGQPDALTSPAWLYVDSLSYTELGQPQEYTLGTTATPAWIYDTYNAQTGLLSTSQVQSGATPVTVGQTSYFYDNAGEPTEESTSQQGGQVQAECLTYDYLGRLSQAWSQGGPGTPSGGECQAGPSQAKESGAAAPFWDQYQYDAAGDLTKVTATPATGGAVVTQTAYHGAGTRPAHGIASQTVTPPSGTAATATYAYDNSGNVTSASGAAAPSGGISLTWDHARRLTQDVSGNGTTSYVYDADGNVLLRTDPSGATLYLGDEEITQAAGTGTLSGVRYYSLGGVTVAARTSAGTVDYLAGGSQGTSTLAIDAGSLQASWRYFDPYGNPVGAQPASWPGTRGFVGGSADASTSLDDLGAREYQPADGAFISPDPVLSSYHPQDLNPYAYGYDNPAANADPTGLCANTADAICPGQNPAATLAAAKRQDTWASNQQGQGPTGNSSSTPCNSVGSRLTGACTVQKPSGSGGTNPISWLWGQLTNGNSPSNEGLDWLWHQLTDANSPVNEAVSNVYVGVSFCLVLCVGASEQDSNLELSIGGLGIGGFGYAGGVNNYHPNNTVNWSPSVCVVPDGVGACGQLTQISGTKTLRPGGGIAVGEGAFAGLNLTILDVSPNSDSIFGFAIPNISIG